MKFGINLASPLPRPWSEKSEHELFQDAIRIRLSPTSLGLTTCGSESITFWRSTITFPRPRYSWEPSPWRPRKSASRTGS
jgi:hypothetical protein